LLDTSPPSAEYALTPFGRELLPAIQAIIDVGLKLKRRRSA
jgi:DNA-binding HxlR family transcriptional regulator